MSRTTLITAMQHAAKPAGAAVVSLGGALMPSFCGSWLPKSSYYFGNHPLNTR